MTEQNQNPKAPDFNEDFAEVMARFLCWACPQFPAPEATQKRYREVVSQLMAEHRRRKPESHILGELPLYGLQLRAVMVDVVARFIIIADADGEKGVAGDIVHSVEQLREERRSQADKEADALINKMRSRDQEK